MTHNRLDTRSLLAGLAAGAAAVLAAAAYFRRRPASAPAQVLVNRALDAAYRRARARGAVRLGPASRYVIFSDHHKGARNRADDFQQCEAAYLAALDYYYTQGHTLVVLGDAEELQEEPKIEAVMRSYPAVLRREARFHPERLARVYGNHDGAWQAEALVRRWMEPFFPGLAYQESLLFEVSQPGGGEPAGEVFLIHGHQGTLDSDLLGFAGGLVLPFYRVFQILTGLGKTSPSQDACLRSKHDNRMYRWVARRRRLVLIAGHTHRPVWSSKTHLDKLADDLYALLRLAPEQRPPDFEALVASLQAEIEERQAKYPPCDDIVKTRPAYFNGGCCRYKDGDITGIEIEGGALRLVKWGRADGEIRRVVLEQTGLAELFAFL